MDEKNKELEECTTCKECNEEKFEGLTENDIEEWLDNNIDLDDFADGDL